MSLYGASFVRADSKDEKDFREICRLIAERNTNWLAESPAHVASEHTIRTHAGTSWVSIENSVGEKLLQGISCELGCEAIDIYAIDEIHLKFQYRHLQNGEMLRILDYSDSGSAKASGAWTAVGGEPEAWEALLFSSKSLKAYENYAAPHEIDEVRKHQAIKLGFSIPWACDGSRVAEIVRHLQLPWDPLRNSFSGSMLSEIIPGSPDRWKRYLRNHGLRPWWKFW